MTLVHVYDSFDCQYPSWADFVLVYVDGKANFARSRAILPNARFIQCTVTGQPGVRVADVERGDLNAVSGAAWAHRELVNGRRPCLYYSTSLRPAVIDALFKLNVAPGRVDWWEANYNGLAELDPSSIAHQYASANDPATAHLAPPGCDVSVAHFGRQLLVRDA